MAKQTETGRQAAVWNPPRIYELQLHSVGSGIRGVGTTQYEGSNNYNYPASPADPTSGYRLPTSGEPVPYPYPWQ